MARPSERPAASLFEFHPAGYPRSLSGAFRVPPSLPARYLRFLQLDVASKAAAHQEAGEMMAIT
jgi:hypothetical protein